MQISLNSIQGLYYKIRKLPLITYFFRFRYDKKFKNPVSAHLFRGVFEDMQQASSSAPDSKDLGYNQKGPAAMYRDRTESIYATDYPVLFWLQPLLKPNLRIFDLGGHVGVSFYAYKNYLNYPENMIWEVCDVPAVTNAGIDLANLNNVDNLVFTNNYSEMEDHEILLASGSLQYIDENLSDMLLKLENAPKHLIINLLPVHDKFPCVTLQNIGTAYCPYRIFKRDELIASIENVGYQLIDDWENPDKSCHIPFHEQNSVETYSGFYFRKVV